MRAMQLTINGKNSNFPSPLNLQDYLKKQNIDLEAIVVEINEKIIKKTEWPTTILQENDVVELIMFVGGG